MAAGRDATQQGMSLSAKTIRGLHAMLRQCPDQAVKERLIPYNPAAGCKLPPTAGKFTGRINSKAEITQPKTAKQIQNKTSQFRWKSGGFFRYNV